MTDNYALGREVGKLANAVDSLAAEVKEIRGEMKVVHALVHRGRGFILGASVILGFALYGGQAFIAKLLNP